MSAMLLILFAASCAHALAKLFKLPHVPLLILAGGSLDYFNAPIKREIAEDALLLGLTFLVFLSGTSLNPWRVGRLRVLAELVGLSQFFLLGIIALLVCLGLGYSMIESSYLALALASSSTLVLINLLKARGELFEPFGRLMVGALLVQDLLIITVISALSNLGGGSLGVISSLALLLSLALLGIVFKKWIAPWLLLHRGVDEELQLVFALGVLFLFMGAANFFNLPFLTGAFVAGVSLSSFPVSGVLRGQFASLNNFFSAVFFVLLGYFVNFPPAQAFLDVVYLSVLLIVLTPLLTAGVALAAGMTLRTGTEAGLLLAQSSEFSIILALIGMDNGDLGEGHLSLVTSVTVITMILTPFLSSDAVSTFLMEVLTKSVHREKGIKKLEGHTVLLGCGESAMIVLKKLLREGQEVVVVDDDAGVIARVRDLGALGVLGNGKDEAVLKHVCVERAKLVISSMRKHGDNHSILKHAHATPVVIRVFDQAEGEEFSRAGAITIPTIDAAGEDLYSWMSGKLLGRNV